MKSFSLYRFILNIKSFSLFGSRQSLILRRRDVSWTDNRPVVKHPLDQCAAIHFQKKIHTRKPKYQFSNQITLYWSHNSCRDRVFSLRSKACEPLIVNWIMRVRQLEGGVELFCATRAFDHKINNWFQKSCFDREENNALFMTLESHCQENCLKYDCCVVNYNTRVSKWYVSLIFWLICTMSGLLRRYLNPDGLEPLSK